MTVYDLPSKHSYDSSTVSTVTLLRNADLGSCMKVAIFTIPECSHESQTGLISMLP